MVWIRPFGIEINSLEAIFGRIIIVVAIGIFAGFIEIALSFVFFYFRLGID